MLRDRDPVIVGLPRGGVPVAAEIADALGAPLDVILVRKLGVPDQPELAMGAIGEDEVRVVNESVLRAVGVTDAQLAAVESAERDRLTGRAERFRRGRARVPLTGRTVVVVDDGIATGATARAALAVARAEGAASVVLAVPVAPPSTCEAIERTHEADEVICLAKPDPFYAVGQFYEDFQPTTDDEVIACLTSHPG